MTNIQAYRQLVYLTLATDDAYRDWQESGNHDDRDRYGLLSDTRTQRLKDLAARLIPHDPAASDTHAHWMRENRVNRLYRAIDRTVIAYQARTREHAA